MISRLLEFGLRWPSPYEDFVCWDEMVAVVETDPMDGPLHRAWNPETWFWYVPGHDDLVTLKELTAVANWQRANGKKSDRPKRQPRPWDKGNKKITPDEAVDTDEFIDWFDGRFAVEA